MVAFTKSTAIFFRARAQGSSMVWKKWCAHCIRRLSNRHERNAGDSKKNGGHFWNAAGRVVGHRRSIVAHWQSKSAAEKLALCLDWRVQLRPFSRATRDSF